MDQKRPELPETAQWYYLQEGDSCGPISASALRHLVATGQIPADTLVWREGMHDWLPARDLGLTGRPAGPTPPPVSDSASDPSAAPGPASPPRAAKDRVGARRAGPRRRSSHAQLWAWGITGAVTLVLVAIVVGHNLMSGAQQPTVTARPRPDQRRASPDSRARERVPPESRGPELTSGNVSSTPRSAAGGSSDMAPGPAGGSGSGGWPAGGESGGRETGDALLDAPSLSSGTARLERPRVLFQEILIHRRPSFGVMGTSMTQDIQYAIVTRLDRQPPLEDGSFRVLQEVLDTRLDHADEMSRSAYESTLKKLIGAKYIFTLNVNCEVTRFDGYESGLSTLPVEMAGGSGFQMTQALDKDGWKEVLERSLLEPARHIAPGQPWTRQMAHDFSPLGSWAGTTTFTQDTTKGPPLLHFKYTHDMKFTPADGEGGALPLRIRDAKFTLVSATGTFVYNPDAQHVTQVAESFHVQGSIATELLGSAGNLEFQERQQWTICLSTQNPWQGDRE